VIVLGHGFSQSKDQHVNQGRHLATRGYIVLVPNSSAASDHSRFADDLRKCIDWIEARDADTNSLFYGRVRADRVGATGHSAGGLSAILAASRDSRIRTVSPMDPVDSGGQGVAALTSVAAPVAITYSEPSSSGRWRDPAGPCGWRRRCAWPRLGGKGCGVKCQGAAVGVGVAALTSVETITVQDDTPLSAAAQRFLRLRVTQP